MKISFQVAILALVVGLSVVTAGTLATYGVIRERQSFDDVKEAYLEQVGDAAAREVGYARAAPRTRQRA